MTALERWDRFRQRLENRSAPPPANDDAAPPDAEPEPAPELPPLLPHQQPPQDEKWSTWTLLGGRGAGKSYAGANWLSDQAEALGEGGRVALVGPTLHDVREVMIEGESGVLNLPRWGDKRPVWEPSRRRLTFPGGCVGYAFSAEDPDSLRGPQFSAAWADEFCAWPAVGSKGAGETLSILRMGLRLPGPNGAAPRLAVTTTPRPTRALKKLRAEKTCVTTHAPTALNAANLAPGFLTGLQDLYGGTRKEAQELLGQIVDLDGALFTAEMLASARSKSPPHEQGEMGRWRDANTRRDGGGGTGDEDLGASSVDAGAAPSTPRAESPARSPSPSLRDGEETKPFDRIIVSVDPSTTATGDLCGIIAAASRLRPDGLREAIILADRSATGCTPAQWARRVAALASEVGADAVVAEVNQGGDMVKETLRAAGVDLPVKSVRAIHGKYTRAEPVAALYEKGRVKHAVPLDALEEELMAFGSGEEASSLDRADALVWAVTDLIIDRPDGEWGPQIRWL